MIGPGKALDPEKYFIVCTDAIANGFTTSPSNSKAQPRMQFPKFAIRDMVESQYRLMKEKFGIDHVVAVVGPSMGGMQVLQWGVSHPDYMDALVAMVPLAKTPAWTVAVLEASRKAIMTDPAWKDGNYEAPPEKGVRLWRDILSFLAARTPDMYSAQFKNGMDVLPWMEQQETALLKAFDANDWIYQTWAYERHDVGTTPGFHGDTAKALASIKARTLILTGTKDLLNPEFEPQRGRQEYPRRQDDDDQPRHRNRPRRRRRRDPGRCGVSQPRDRRVSRREARRQEAGLASVMRYARRIHFSNSPTRSAHSSSLRAQRSNPP